MKTEMVAVPTPAGARAAYLITLGADVHGANGSPVAYATYVGPPAHPLNAWDHIRSRRRRRQLCRRDGASLHR